MKYLYSIIATLMFSNFMLSQSTNSGATGNDYNSSRFLGWNTTNGTNPLLFKTNNLNRFKLNGNVSYMVNGYTDTRNGYMLLGNNNNSMNTLKNKAKKHTHILHFPSVFLKICRSKLPVNREK